MKTIKKLSELDGKIINVEKRPIRVRAIELEEKIRIKTREGELYGMPGDFVIEGIEGEIYPIGKEIFEKTYRILK